jgi:hypothetical protein
VSNMGHRSPIAPAPFARHLRVIVTSGRWQVPIFTTFKAMFRPKAGQRSARVAYGPTFVFRTPQLAVGFILFSTCVMRRIEQIGHTHLAANGLWPLATGPLAVGSWEGL